MGSSREEIISCWLRKGENNFLQYPTKLRGEAITEVAVSSLENLTSFYNVKLRIIVSYSRDGRTIEQTTQRAQNVEMSLNQC